MRRQIKKNFLLLVFTLPLLFAFQCDDEFVPDEEIENLGLIKVKDDKTTFSVGDYIFINTDINNQQTTIDGKTLNLSDYVVDNRLNPDYSLAIYKVTSNGEKEPYFIENVQEIEGVINYNDQNPAFYIQNIYNEANTTFSSSIGIQLLEKGTYILDTEVIRNNLRIISFELRSTLGVLVLTTSISNSDEEGIYKFTVE